MYALGDVPLTAFLSKRSGMVTPLNSNKNAQDQICMLLAGMAMDRRLGSNIAHGYDHDYQRIWKTAFRACPTTGDAVKLVRGAEVRMPALIQHIAPAAMLLGGELYRRGKLNYQQMDNILSKTMTRLKSKRELGMDERRIDHDGRMHVDTSNLSMAAVNPYQGDEIPHWELLGLEPKKTYMLLRHPDELKRAADSFNGLPILDTHVPMDADSHLPYLVIGATGSRAKFEPPYLTNAISLWTRDAIDNVNSGQRKELSCAYSYLPVMTPGVYEGRHYDGIMTDLRGNHVALVREGRAGADCVVGDSNNVKTVRRFAMYGAYDQIPSGGANIGEKPKPVTTSKREDDGAARVGEKLQGTKEKLSAAARTKTGPDNMSAAFDQLYALVEHPANPRGAMITLIELLKQSGFTTEQILQKITQMSTPNDDEDKKLNWSGSGAGAEDASSEAFGKNVAHEYNKGYTAPSQAAAITYAKQREGKPMKADEEPKMPNQQPNMQQMEDPNRISATTNQPCGPTQQETFGRDLTENPHLDPNLPDEMKHRGQAFGIPGTPNTAGTRTPSTQLGRNGNGNNKFATLIELLDALEAAEQNGEEVDDTKGLMDAELPPPITGQRAPATTGVYHDQQPLIKPESSPLPVREATPKPARLPGQDSSCAVGDARHIYEQRRMPEQRLDQHLRASGMRSATSRDYAVGLGRKQIAQDAAKAEAGSSEDDFFKFCPGAAKIEALSPPVPSTSASRMKLAQDNAAVIWTWQFNPMTNALEQVPVKRTR
jgi:hypothetical protein